MLDAKENYAAFDERFLGSSESAPPLGAARLALCM